MVARTERQLEALGERFARHLFCRPPLYAPPCILALSGELGAGKTTFLRGFARGLGIRTRITSPTFVLAKRYRIPAEWQISRLAEQQIAKSQSDRLPACPPAFHRRRCRTVAQSSSLPRWFWHIDAYRLRNARDLASINFAEIIAEPRNIVAIEWADRVRTAVPKRAIWITFRHHLRGRVVAVKKSKAQDPNVNANPKSE